MKILTEVVSVRRSVSKMYSERLNEWNVCD